MNKPEFDNYYKNRLLRWVDYSKKAFLKKSLAQHQRLKIVDLGCGAAGVSSFLTSAHHLTGVDENLKLLEQAASKGLHPIQSKIESTPFENESFDVIIMIDSIEHIENRNAVLKEVHRILAKGGLFLSITPRYNSLLWLIGERIGNRLSGLPSGHISPFTDESLRYFLQTYFGNSKIEHLNFGMWLASSCVKK